MYLTDDEEKLIQASRWQKSKKTGELQVWIGAGCLMIGTLVRAAVTPSLMDAIVIVLVTAGFVGMIIGYVRLRNRAYGLISKLHAETAGE